MKDLKFTEIVERNVTDHESNSDEQQYLIDENYSSSIFKFYMQNFQTKHMKYIICTLVGFLIILLVTFIVTIELKSTSDTSANKYKFSWDSFKSVSSKGAVATDSKICSDIGVNILSKGGNSVDAAIAATFCLGVVSPISSGIGGGCLILIYNASNQDSAFIDSREVAPKAAYANMFTNNSLAAQNGGLAIAVLGEVKGLYLAFEKHGSGHLRWKDLVTPAADLAKHWIISPSLADTMKKESYDDLKSGNYSLLSELFLRKNGQLKKSGDVVEQPALAKTLRFIADQGPDYIYYAMAETIATEIQDAGGIMTADDIRSYYPIVYPTLQTMIMGYKYLGVEGCSSGGPVIAGILNFMSSFSEPLISLGNLYYHRLAEAMKHTFAIRLHLGDPSYVDSVGPLSALLSHRYMSDLANLNTSDFDVQLLSSYGGKYGTKNIIKNDHGTTHISIIDSDGNAVALTSTINTYFGSKVISKSTGIIFNNEMDDFSIPNSPNYFGLAPSPLNFPEPFKRPLSSMTPSILLDKHGKVRLIGGASGGPRIITATAQVILNFIGRGMNLLDAVVHPRIHSQLLPNVVDIEVHTLTQFGIDNIVMSNEVYQALVSRNQIVQRHDGSMGVTQFISIDPDTNEITAVSDPRKDGYPASQV